MFILIVKYLNDQPFSSSSLLPSQAASSQTSSAREPLNSLTLPASCSAIFLEPGYGIRLEMPSNIINRTDARAWRRLFSKSSIDIPRDRPIRTPRPRGHRSTDRFLRAFNSLAAVFLVFEPSDVIEPFAMAGLGVFNAARVPTSKLNLSRPILYSSVLTALVHSASLLRVVDVEGDRKVVEAIPDRAHDFGFSGHL